jgi:hypothetical protein
MAQSADMGGFPSNQVAPASYILHPSLLFANSEQGYWLDASDLSTMWQDAAGTVPVTAHGDPIGRWTDKSGNGYVFTQATAGNRPLLNLDAFGKYSVNYVSTDTLTSTTTINMSGSNKLLIAAALAKGSAGTAGILLEGGYGNAGGMNLYASVGADSTIGFPCTGTANGYKNMGMYGTGRVVATATWDMAITSLATSVISRVNGRETTYSFGGNSNAASTTAGANITHHIGSSNGSVPFTGQLYGIVVRGTLTSTDQLKGVEEYMNSLMGLW